MATGDSADIQSRVTKTIPPRWFSTGAPIANAIIGGLSDLASWLYALLYYAKAQMRLATASGPWLDIYSYDFLGLFLKRKGLADTDFRAKIKQTILQERVTRAGMISTVEALTGSTPIIFEPWSTYDAGAWNSPNGAFEGRAFSCAPGGGWNVASGWNVNASGYNITRASFPAADGAGGWGSTSMPAQVLVTVRAPVAQGIPTIGGFDQGPAAWDGGIGEWADDAMLGIGELSDAEIYETVAITKPTGVVAWTRIL